MSLVTVIALKDFAFEGQAVYAGQAVTMEAIQAAIRGNSGDVSLDPHMRATYQTRDMTAAPVLPPVVALSVEAPKTRWRGRPRKSKSLSV